MKKSLMKWKSLESISMQKMIDFCPTARQTIALQFTAATLVYVDDLVMAMVYCFI